MSNRPDTVLQRGRLGYALEMNDREAMMVTGIDPVKMLRIAETKVPVFDVATDKPNDLFECLDQANQGACQGHSLALCFTICYWLETGRLEWFSRAAAYYVSQRKDGLRGDVGSTLSGGQWVATQHGLCLEKDWEYPSRYAPQEPSGIVYPFKMAASKPTSDWEVVQQALDLGLPVQDGLPWNNELERSIATTYTGRSAVGGHSTTIWRRAHNGNYFRYNSWGKWDGDGCAENTPNCMKQQVEHSQSDHVIYMPAGMIYPELVPVG